MTLSATEQGSKGSWLTRTQRSWKYGGGWEYGWGIGLLIIALQMTHPLITPQTTMKGADWQRYYIIGIWAMAYVGSAFIRFPKQLLLPFTITKILLTLYAVLIAELYCLPDKFSWNLIGISILIFIWNIGHPLYRQPTSFRNLYPAVLRTLSITANILLMICIFSLCQRMISSVGRVFNPNRSDWSFAGFILAIEFTRCFIAPRPISNPANRLWQHLRAIFLYEPNRAARHVLYFAALYIIVLFCFRIDGLVHNSLVPHHWKAILEPAESLRAGEWLLWNVPAQYGFLLPLVLALLPTADAWESLYWLNGALLALSGYMIFFLLFTRFKSYSGFVFSLLLCLSSITLVQTSGMGDYRLFPSAGALRFIWMYVLVGYVLYGTHWLHIHEAKRLPASHVAIGNMLWMLGVLWSPESAVLSTVIWLPALALMQCAPLFSGEAPPSWRTLIKTLLFSPISACVSLVGIIGAIVAFYSIQLGHGPDIDYIAAYPAAYKAGFGSIIIDVYGGVGWLLALFMGGVCLCRSYCANTPLTRQSLLMITAFYVTLSSMWMCSSYYVSRSHENNIINLIPILVFSTTIMLKLMTVISFPPLVKQTYTAFVAVFFSALIVVGGRTLVEKRYDSLLLTFPFTRTISSQILRPIPPSLWALMDRFGITPAASIFPLAKSLQLAEQTNFTAFKPWGLPSSVVSYYEPLPYDLYKRAAMRSLEHGCQFGWVITPTYDSLANYPWIAVAITTYYQQVNELSDGGWKIIRFEKKTPSRC